MLTKNDVKVIKKLLEPLQKDLSETKADISATKLEVKAVNAHNARIENKLVDIEQKFDKNLTAWKDEFFTRLDLFLKRVQTAEDENAILQAKEESRNETRDELDKRLKKLEDIHPNHRHQTA